MMINNSNRSPIKYIIVTGGVISGVGKGIIASSTAALLKGMGLSITSIKIDPYLNIDAGTISPFDHGEVFVLDDGGEVDLDLGNYERFIDITLRKDHNITTGKIYQQVIEKERRGDYLGKTVQIVPHLTDVIQEWIERVAMQPVDSSRTIPQVCIVELGGTVGDIESAPFVEALRQFQFRVGLENFIVIHVSLVPTIGSSGEQKTKPTQASVRDLRGLGLSPDIIACRSAQPLEHGIKEKLAMFCQVPPNQIIAVHDCRSIYHVPLLLEEQKMHDFISKRFGLNVESGLYLESWRNFAKGFVANEERTIRVAIVGKYTYLQDSYLSVSRALHHAGQYCNCQVQINWIEASELEDESKLKYQSSWNLLKASDAIIIPGGFGDRGIEGKIKTIKYARESKIPILGLCLGLQLAVIESCRTFLQWADANSTEMSPETTHPVVISMPEVSKTHMGGTMRLGERASALLTGSKSSLLYERIWGNGKIVHERHRHRYEVNPQFVSEIESKTPIRFVGKDEDTGQRMEFIEIQDHPFFVATQAHSEFKSRPLRPSPLFVGLLEAALSL